MTLPDGLAELIGAYLARQRWYAGHGVPPPGSLRVVESAELAPAGRPGGGARLHWAVVEVDGVRYQLLVGERPAGQPAEEPPPVPEPDVLGRLAERWFYDATADPELMLGFHEVVVGRPARHVRPIGAEQSNTSLVYDERTILKLYRRLLDGPNPEVEVTSALASVGFTHVAEPVATWRSGGTDLAFAQRFLAGGAEGWALALASVRAQLGGAAVGAAGADFATEAANLGRLTAELHLALARTFPVAAEAVAAGWAAFVDDLEAQLDDLARAPSPAAPAPAGSAGPAAPAGNDVPDGAPSARERALALLRSVRRPGPALRVHGDFHLGQVMRAGGTWYVLDFEGEPARSLDERLRLSSPAKDVAGMLRSLDYAASFALRGGDPATPADPAAAAGARARAVAWEQGSRAVYLQGYRSTEGAAALLGDPAEVEVVLAAFELEKALYELRYEQAYRPDWADIPAAAVQGVLDRLAGPGPVRSG